MAQTSACDFGAQIRQIRVFRTADLSTSGRPVGHCHFKLGSSERDPIHLTMKGTFVERVPLEFVSWIIPVVAPVGTVALTSVSERT